MTRWLFASLVLLVAAPADGASTTYALNLAGSSDGYFTVDGSLAAPVGPSAVALDDLLINLDTSAGILTFGLDDLTAGFVEARFLDGVLAGLRSVGATAEVTTPGTYGIAIFLSALAGTAADIDPNFAGEGNFTIVSLPDVTPIDDVCCSYGFAPAPVPEPGSILFLSLGFSVAIGACAFGQRSAGL